MATATSITPASGRSFGLSSRSSFKRALAKLYDPSAIANVNYTRQFGDVVFSFDDFTEITFNADPWTVTKDAGATTWAISAMSGGAIRGVTGATDTDGISLLGPAIYYGDKNAGMQVRFKVSAITDVAVEFGFIDTVTDKTMPAITDIDTPAFGAGLAEGAVVSWDTDSTLTTMALVTDSATYTTAYKKNLYTKAINGTTGLAPTAATWMTGRVQLDGDNVHCFIWNENNVLVDEAHISAAGTAALTGGIEGGTAVAPWIAVATRTTASRNFDIDYIARWQDR